MAAAGLLYRRRPGAFLPGRHLRSRAGAGRGGQVDLRRLCGSRRLPRVVPGDVPGRRRLGGPRWGGAPGDPSGPSARRRTRVAAGGL